MHSSYTNYCADQLKFIMYILIGLYLVTILCEYPTNIHAFNDIIVIKQ